MEAEEEEDGNGLRSNTLSTTFQCFLVAHPLSHSCVEEKRYLCVLNSIGDPFHVKGGGESEIRGGGGRRKEPSSGMEYLYESHSEKRKAPVGPSSSSSSSAFSRTTFRKDSLSQTRRLFLLLLQHPFQIFQFDSS